MKKDELFETMMDGSSSFSKKMRSKILEFKFHDNKQNSLVISNKRDTWRRFTLATEDKRSSDRKLINFQTILKRSFTRLIVQEDSGSKAEVQTSVNLDCW